MSEPKCGSFATFHRGRLLRFMFPEYELSDLRTKFFTSHVYSLLHVSNTVLKIFLNRNPTNLLFFSIYKSELIHLTESHIWDISRYKKKQPPKNPKTFEYIIHFPFSWRLSRVLFKTQRWKHHNFKFDPFIITVTYVYILAFISLKSQWCFLFYFIYLQHVSTSGFPVLKCLSLNYEVLLKKRGWCVGQNVWTFLISEKNSLCNATRYSPSLYLESLRFPLYVQ